MSIEEEIKAMGGVLFERVGSSVTCDPPVTNTDIDYVVYAPRNFLIDAVENQGYSIGGSFWEDNEFHSLKRERINLIVTQSLDFYSKFLLATDVAKELNLLKKQDRVTLFQAILYGNPRR